MKLIFLIVICLTSFYQDYSQNNQQKWKELVKSGDLKKIVSDKSIAPASTAVDTIMESAISEADENFSLTELTMIVNFCSEYCYKSTHISQALAGWLRENHSIYKDKTPTDANQFRAFLLSSLSRFPGNEEIYKYVKSEILFSDHTINIAAAAATAKNFPDKSAELIPLMEPFLGSSFSDEWVDIRTPELNYPILNPTKARYEIILTLTAYGARAYKCVKLLDEICKNCGEYGDDSVLYTKAKNAAEYIRKITPPCCQKETAVKASQHGMMLISKENRKVISAGNIKLLDQEGDSPTFKDLTDKPFVLTFFYTQCTNALKCISSVHRLGELETECLDDNLAERVGIYAITYDPDFDTPSILKKYGEMYGVRFNKNMKFLKAEGNSGAVLFDQLQLRVNYGGGTVNQHGIQLFVFDKKGRIAAICDNDTWSVSEVKNCLASLIDE
ncbi:MAG TPA: SCO family protein [Chitinophagaceae bacterium]|jgi:cytochrome oxidase Cu insertion factor (SCO1/SenC/PrrC family)